MKMALLSPFITSSGWVYSLGSFYAPDGSVLGRPMYYPDEKGTRLFRGRKYNKYLRHSNGASLIKQPYKPFWQMDPWSVQIPVSQIAEVFDSQKALADWLSTNDIRADLINTILAEFNISKSNLALGGSLGVGCQTDDSDVDLLIYGSDLAELFRAAIKEALYLGKTQLMSPELVDRYANRYAHIYGLQFRHVHKIFSDDITKIYIGDKKISFIFVYSDLEKAKVPTVIYNERKRQEVPDICFFGRLINASAAWLYPRNYLVEDNRGNLFSLWSHHWLRDPTAEVGSEVEVSGSDLGRNIISLTTTRHHISPVS
jgi:predicted nucleotidyltransferase